MKTWKLVTIAIADKEWDILAGDQHDDDHQAKLRALGWFADNPTISRGALHDADLAVKDVVGTFEELCTGARMNERRRTLPKGDRADTLLLLDELV